MATCYGNQLTWRKDNTDVGSYYAMRASDDPQEYLEFMDWEIAVLLQWSRQDPVSQKEIARQDAVSDFQHNRNPYIDYPHLEEYIWGVRKGQPLNLDSLQTTVIPDTTIVTPPSDTTVVVPGDTLVPPVLPFEALAATRVSSNGFQANWTDDESGIYTLSVYRYEESEQATLISLPTMTQDDIAACQYVTLAGNTYNDTEGLRLGTSRGNGTLTLSGFNLTTAGTLTISAMSFGSDGSSLAVVIGNDTTVQTLSTTATEYNFTVPAGTTEITLAQTAQKKRLIICSLTLTGGGTGKVMLEGYPLAVDGNSHYVSVPEEGTYYYTVRTEGGVVSEEIRVVATGEETATEWPYITYEELHIDGLTLIVTGIVDGASIRLYTADGRLIVHQASVTDGTAVLQAPSAGLYILQVGHLRTKFMVF